MRMSWLVILAMSACCSNAHAVFVLSKSKADHACVTTENSACMPVGLPRTVLPHVAEMCSDAAGMAVDANGEPTGVLFLHMNAGDDAGTIAIWLLYADEHDQQHPHVVATGDAVQSVLQPGLYRLWISSDTEKANEDEDLWAQVLLQQSTLNEVSSDLHQGVQKPVDDTSMQQRIDIHTIEAGQSVPAPSAAALLVLAIFSCHRRSRLRM